jgi:hypothetical protein
MVRWVAWLCLVGCGGGSMTTPCSSTAGACGGKQAEQAFDEPSAVMLDALLVIDDSASMAAHAEAVAALGRALGDTVSQLPGVVDLQALVVTTSTREHGSGECAHPPASPPLCAADRVLRMTRTCGARSNFTSGLADTFACAVAVGTGGCAVEQPLAAMRAALESPSLRPGSHPFVLLVTDEDDCSAPAGPLPFSVDPASAAADDPALSARCREADQRGQLDPVAAYADLLRGRGTALSVLTVPPAPRLELLAASLPTSEVRALSADNAAISLSALGQRVGILIGSPCAPEGLLDHDLGTPGLQPECVVTEQDPDGGTHPLPSCDGSGPPCWRLTASPECASSGLAWSIDRGGCFPPQGTQLHTTCAVAP